MMETIKVEANHSDPDKGDAFILAVISDGCEKNSIHGKDGNAVDLPEVYKLLSESHSLKRKPKFVITECRRGGKFY